MELEDRLTIATPEGVDLDLVVAGLGSRFMAFVVDLALQLVVILALTFGTVSLGEAGPAIFAVGAFVVFFGYHVAFETLARGRTPGKMLTHLRVVGDDGTPVRFVASVVRNVVRLVDLLPVAYTVGVIAVLATARHQRLGDLAAGTIVVRDAGLVSPEGFAPSPVTPVMALPPEAAGWDVSAVSGDEVGTVRAFLERRADLDPDARVALATQLATRLAPRVVGPPTDSGPERFLEWVVAAKLARG